MTVIQNQLINIRIVIVTLGKNLFPRLNDPSPHPRAAGASSCDLGIKVLPNPVDEVSTLVQIVEGESLRFRVKFYPPHPDIQLKASFTFTIG